MNEIKWAVVVLGYENAYVYSVDLFDNYEAATEFMYKDAQMTNEECMGDITLEDYGDKIIAFVDGEPCYYWAIKATNIH